MNNKWIYKKIGEVCVVERGGSPRPINEFITDSSDGINWIKIGDTNDSMYITKTEQKIIPEGMRKSRFVKQGDFLLSNSMSFGRPYILKIDGCIHDGWLVLRDNDDIFDKRFLYYFLSSPTTYRKFQQLAVGGVVNNLNSSMVREVLVPIIPKAEQIDICNQLDIVKKVISYRKTQLKELDSIIRSRFVEMFGTPLVNDMQWIEKKANDICIRITDGSHFSPKDNGEGIPMLSVKDMSKEGFVYENCKYANNEDYEMLKKNDCKPLKNDVLISKDGSYFYYGFVVREEIEQAVLSSIAILRPNKSLINPDYLRTYMMSSEIVGLVGRRYITGAAIKRVILKGIREIPVMLPPLELQNQYAEFVNQVDKLKYEVQTSLDETQLLFDSLMQCYFD